MFSFINSQIPDDEQYFNQQVQRINNGIKDREERIKACKKLISDYEDEILQLRKKLNDLQKSKLTGNDCLENFKLFIIDKYKGISSIKDILDEFEKIFVELQKHKDECEVCFRKINGQFKLYVQMKKQNNELSEMVNKLYKIFDLFSI